MVQDYYCTQYRHAITCMRCVAWERRDGERPAPVCGHHGTPLTVRLVTAAECSPSGTSPAAPTGR
jgi:hypothetical protein